jgi:predicted nucleic acid-binding protein
MMDKRDAAFVAQALSISAEFFINDHDIPTILRTVGLISVRMHDLAHLDDPECHIAEIVDVVAYGACLRMADLDLVALSLVIPTDDD